LLWEGPVAQVYSSMVVIDVFYSLDMMKTG